MRLTLAEFSKRVEDKWKNSHKVAWTLVLMGLLLALGATYWPQSPGVSIGLLALVAGVMSLRPEMHIFEKLAWIAILTVFAILEVHGINRNDENNKNDREAQNKAFDAIVGKLTRSTETAKNNYNSTIDHVDGVLEQTKEIANLAKENLRNVTGGDSYAYLTPQNFEGSVQYAIGLNNAGNEILTGLSVTISEILTKGCIPFPFGPFPSSIKPDCALDSGLIHPVTVPTLAAHAVYEMPTTMNIRPDGTDVLYVRIQAQNGDAEEVIWFRKAKSGKGLAYRFEVRTGVIRAKKFAGKVRISSGWQEPRKQPEY